MALGENGHHFLRDLGEIGATQVATENPMSTTMKEYVVKHRYNRSNNRSQPQVISGAGLYISRVAICTLPPFMNLKKLITWVDDHCKRRLHEVLGHLDKDDIERVQNALFVQNRHPNGVCKKDIDWAKETYFKRLFFGCILHSLIVMPDNSKGPLSKYVSMVVDNPECSCDEAFREAELKSTASFAARELLEIWKDADYGNVLLKEWATNNTGNIDDFVTQIVNDAISYIYLVSQWQKYVHAIGLLTSVDAYWLFRRVD